jgi:hypothetical protein
LQIDSMRKALDSRCAICQRRLTYAGVGALPKTCRRRECRRAAARKRKLVREARGLAAAMRG